MRKLLTAFVLSIVPLVAAAQPAVEKLAAMLGSMQSYQALFIQIVTDQRGARVQETAGYIQAKRPNLFFWETQPPLGQQIVADGQEIWIFDPDLEQVTVKKLGDDIQNTPALLLSGDVQNLQQAYEISHQQPAEAIDQFMLAPKGNDSLFDQLRLTFENGVLTEMRLRDSLGQRTVISFSKIETNPSIPDSTFRFQVPEGVDVFREQ